MSASSTRRQYRHPPIEEALVEFRFSAGREWDLTIPGKLHERIKETYPVSRQQKLIQAAVQASPGQAPGFSVQEGIGRVQLLDSEGRRLLSLGPDVLSVNVLRPYEGWSHFRPRIDSALSAYAAVAEASRVNRIGVRYINKVVIPAADVNLEEYFECGPIVPVGVPSRLNGALSRTEHVFDDGIKLILTFATVGQAGATSAFLLDLDVIWEGSSPLSIAQALDVVEDLHGREGTAFEAAITDKAREVFDGD